jgi:hypothetical protein
MPRKLTLDEFINKANEIHNKKFDYTKVVYIDSNTRVTIICPMHGEFKQKPSHHLTGSECQQCGKITNKSSLILTREELLRRFEEAHGEKYDYSQTNYINYYKKIDIICPAHGVFKTTAVAHYLHKRGCPKCKDSWFVGDCYKLKRQDTFVKRVNQIWGEVFDFGNLNFKTLHKPICITCKKHNHSFETKPCVLLQNKGGCVFCSEERHREKHHQKMFNKFLEKSKTIHGNSYDYSLVTEYVNSFSPINIICKTHGVYETTADAHIYGKSGCPICSKSKGEAKIEMFLTCNNIEYTPQKYIIINGSRHFFDFYLPKYELFIEYDGKQHFHPIKHFGGEPALKVIKERDEIKNDFCRSNSKLLLRIPYTSYSEIDDILEQQLLSFNIT